MKLGLKQGGHTGRGEGILQYIMLSGEYRRGKHIRHAYRGAETNWDPLTSSPFGK